MKQDNFESTGTGKNKKPPKIGDFVPITDIEKTRNAIKGLNQFYTEEKQKQRPHTASREQSKEIIKKT